MRGSKLLRRVIVASLGVALVGILGTIILSTETTRSLINKVAVISHRIAPMSKEAEQLSRIKADMLRRYAHLGQLQGRALAKAIQVIADKIPIGSSPDNLEGDLFELYNNAVVRHSTSYSCQGVNLIFRAMLTAFGIESRAVQFYANKEQEPDAIVTSHSTADVFADGRWEAMDATFNFHLEGLDGTRLDWLTAYQIKAAGKKLRVVSDDPSETANPLKKAGVLLSRDMKFVAIIGTEIVVEPRDWDGIFRIKGRLHWDVARDSYSADYKFPAIINASRGPAMQKAL